MKILNIAFYRFVALSSLPERRVIFRERCHSLGLKGTILLSEEGINGFLAGTADSIRAFQSFLLEMPVFSGMTFKESESSRIPFGRMRVKLKKEIISMGHVDIRPESFTAPRVSAEELCRWMDEKRDIVVLDTRNTYEIEKGTFENAIDLDIQTFRKFPEKLMALPQAVREKPVVMFCTGGIRCEKATAFALKQGFREVYQLDGGILKYFEECGGKHYRGGCFVFDERVALDEKLEADQPEKLSG